MNRFLSKIPYDKIIPVVLIAIITVALYLLLRKATKGLWKQTGKSVKKTVYKTILDILKALILLGAILLILQICGVNVTSALAGLGIVGMVIGLALQDLLKDVIMGFHILSDHFFEVGDCVIYGGEECEVQSFSLKTTKLKRLSDLSVISVCNRNIEGICALSKVLEMTVPMPYDTPAEDVRDAVREACCRIKDLEEVTECQYRGAYTFGDSSIPYKLWVFCSPCNREIVRFHAMAEIIDTLKEKGIAVPFNQLDVHMKAESGSKR